MKRGVDLKSGWPYLIPMAITPLLALLFVMPALSCGASSSRNPTGDAGNGGVEPEGGNGGARATGGSGGQSSTKADAAAAGGSEGGSAGAPGGHGGSSSTDTDAAVGTDGKTPMVSDGSSNPGSDAPGDNDEVVFATVGDYGADTTAETNVAALIKSWNPAFVITLGDNNYGGAGALDTEIGKYYASFIGDYKGAHGPGSPTNRFWPSAGNHDWDSNGLKAYLDYFTLPGKERYYEQRIGRVHLFSIDSDEREPDGNSATSTQAKWLQAALAASTACHKIVYFHEPPYTSGNSNGASPFMRWPFKAWGATMVMTGHEHVYERLDVDGLPYIINGLGGDSRYAFGTPVSQSKFRYAAQNGAMRVVANATSITYEFWTTAKTKIESFVVNSNCQ